jgi:hypothetical protein
MILTWTINEKEQELRSPISYIRGEGWVPLTSEEADRLPIAQFYSGGMSQNMSGKLQDITFNFPRTFLSERLQEAGVVNFTVISMKERLTRGTFKRESPLNKLRGFPDILRMILVQVDPLDDNE